MNYTNYTVASMDAVAHMDLAFLVSSSSGAVTTALGVGRVYDMGLSTNISPNAMGHPTNYSKVKKDLNFYDGHNRRAGAKWRKRLSRFIRRRNRRGMREMVL